MFYVCLSTYRIVGTTRTFMRAVLSATSLGKVNECHTRASSINLSDFEIVGIKYCSSASKTWGVCTHIIYIILFLLLL